jgi:hypothetical protein
MKTTALALTLALGLTSPASAQYCSYDGSNLTCTGGGYAGPSIGGSFAQGYLAGQHVAAHYAMVNAYREAHGLPRCHYGILGAILSASDGRPMC